MKLQLRPGRLVPVTFFATAIALCAIPFTVHADDWDKKTIITVDQPIQVTNTYLEPGSYVFKLLNSSSDRHIVQIYNRDQNHLIDTVMAIPNYHLQRVGKTEFTFWETPPGTAPAVRAWFWPGDNYGQEFRYPTQLKQIALATPPPAPKTFAPAPPPAITPEPPVETPAPEAQPQPQAEVQPVPAQEPELLAQNSPPPAPPQPEAQAAPAPQPATDNANQPEELPKTASPYPLIGLAGLLSAGLFGLLRVKRLS